MLKSAKYPPNRRRRAASTTANFRPLLIGDPYRENHPPPNRGADFAPPLAVLGEPSPPIARQIPAKSPNRLTGAPGHSKNEGAMR